MKPSVRWRLLGASTFALMLFGITVNAGLHLPSEAVLDRVAAPAGLDYESPVHRLFARLRQDFVTRVLGLGGSDSTPPQGAPPSRVPLAVSAGGTREAARAPGDRVTARDFVNDDFDSAYEIPSVPFTGSTDNSRATREPDEPADCAATGGTIWYRYRSPGATGLVATTFGSRHPTALGAYRRAGDGRLERVLCNLDKGGNSQVVLTPEPDTYYWFQVTAPGGGGRSLFSLDSLGSTTMVSTSPSGEPGNGRSHSASVSAGGRHVAFHSLATNLVEGDANGRFDVFVRDMVTGVMELVSVSSTGELGNGESATPVITADGRFVAFASTASNLVQGDTNNHEDFFVRDRWARRTTRVSLSSGGTQGSVAAHRLRPHTLPRPSVDITPDGRYVVFHSDLSGLVPGDDQNRCTDPSVVGVIGEVPHSPVAVPLPGPDDDVSACRDVFVHDRVTGATRSVSVSSSGEPSDGDSGPVAISADGRFVAFASSGSNLVEGDTNLRRDVFVHDLARRTTERVSVSSAGEQSNAHSGDVHKRGHTSISDDGRYVAFLSEATNLTEGDSNLEFDVYLHDRRERTTSLVSASREDGGGRRAEGGRHAALSSDGRYLALGISVTSRSLPHISFTMYVIDRVTDTLLPACIAPSGEEATGCSEPDISPEGEFVVFESAVPGLENMQVAIHEIPSFRARRR